MNFAWDEDKNQENIRKHGFDFADAWEIFEAPMRTALSIREKIMAKVEQELIKLEDEWHNAYVRRDAEPLERILADEYIAISGNGGSGNKAQAIAGLRADKSTYEYSTPYDMDFRFYGDTVVVIGRTKEKGKAENGTEFTVEYRWTDVFVKRNGRWQCVAAQIARVPPPKPKS